jgi:hypothetical protein
MLSRILIRINFYQKKARENEWNYPNFVFHFSTAKIMVKLVVFIFAFLQFTLSVSQTLNYSTISNWAVHPTKLPEVLFPYLQDTTNQSKADVFYVYPTLFLDKKDERWNIPIDDSAFRKKILDNAIRFQASAWVECGRMFVPYYRQAHIRSYRNLENGGREALLFAYSDIKAAFQYYLDHFNNGKPIILAGHSQGSTHLTLLLKDFFDGKDLQNQLVAAYLPGIGLKKNEFGTIPLMTSPNQIGGFISWNTFKRKVNKEKFEMWYKGKAVVNPVTWNSDKVADRKKHKGFLFSNNKIYGQSFSTHVIDGAIWISTPHFPYRSMAWTMDDYHIGDINLFWEDVKLNSKQRLNEYLINNISKE